MSYEYLPIEQAKNGNIVEFNNEGYKGSYTHKSFYTVKDSSQNVIYTLCDDKGITNNGMIKSNFKLIKTKPGSEAKVGDTVICIENSRYISNQGRNPIKGQVYTIQSSNGPQISPDGDRMWVKEHFKVLCKAPLLHQGWKDFYELGKSLQVNNISDPTTGWKDLTPECITEDYWNSSTLEYRIKPTEQTQNIFKDSKSKILKDYLLLTSDEDLSFAHSLDLVKDWNLGKQTYPLILFSYAVGYNTSISYWDRVYKEALTVQEFANKYNLQILKTKEEKPMKKLDLALLVQFIAEVQQDQEPKVNATNANHVAIMTEDTGEYVGYVYANTLEELEDIVRLPANECRQLHVFDYSTTLAQKPRKVIKVERVQDEEASTTPSN